MASIVDTHPGGDGERPRKRVRKSRSRGLRTKTGCLTCRKRHKKCDERSPVCGPCSTSSRECVYSESASGPVSASESRPIAAVSFVGVPTREPDAVAVRQKRQTASMPVAAIVPSPQPLFLSRGEVSQPGEMGPLIDPYRYAYSPDTMASELLTADLASTRWLDLLATDAAQADSGFSLAPSPVPEDSVFNDGYTVRANNVTDLSAPDAAESAAVSERHAWQLDQDILLQSHEALLFRAFAERASLWLDLFDPHKHFSTYAIRLALRNLGLMKAILALSARHDAIVQANIGNTVGTDTSEAVQYYYETLHYVQTALQYNTYAHSEELLATALVISTYEMLDASDSNWKRHLKGVFWIQRSQDVHGASGGLQQAVWWAWLRQDVWAAFRERRRCFSFWRPVKDFPELSQDELADRAVYLLSQTVNYCAKVDTTPPEEGTLATRAEMGEALMAMLERWKTFLGPKFEPLPTPTNHSRVFQGLWVHPPQFGVALQVFAKILVTLHRPATAGFDGYLKTQRTLSEAVATICGVAMESKDEGCQIMSAQCLFGAGLCVQDETKRNTIISLIDACEARTGWPMAGLRNDLKAEWAKLG
ncbi:uncharacterized protein BCR38DRAFT_357512 [Pseudomassariella vexata]|uniref:Zn(2)-C6 fungal-type domain-containing protein n=1 Tax=Pseudomassariella vexata TaxID=1141098 RepID=A0A1Y2D6E5_9PEZI|nr:uncharacterized protein BCR38DRAFT_357512 [Pseudomassariella vexata]ORY54842.1 hypothetical protein BCR38DRAFT_357512 [Pseudomassariella vexata]